MGYFNKSNYDQERLRPKLFTNYLENMILYLKAKNHTASENDIRTFVKEFIKNNVKFPMIETVYHKTEGNSEVVVYPLNTYLEKIISQNNVSPSGSVYYKTSSKESFLKTMLEKKVQERNKYKKLYLKYEAQNKQRESQYYNSAQANAKILANAVAGGMNIKQFILGSKAGFNAITSSGRISVKQGYSFIERAIGGNLYLPTTSSAISYIFNHVRNIHDDFESMLYSCNLYIPTVKDVLDYMLYSLRNYISNPNVNDLTDVISSLTDVQRSYVLYVGCLKNLCVYNDSLMRNWIDSCFYSGDITLEDVNNIDIDTLSNISGDIIACVLSVKYSILGENPDKPGKWLSLNDAKKINPKGVKQFIFICNHFIRNFEKNLLMMKSIFQVQTTFSKLIFHQDMARRVVLLSDTDSNIFSTQELVLWKTHALNFSNEAYEMNAFTTFILSQSLEHVFGRLSAGFGIEKNDIKKINMKNEFLYPVMITTSLGKHYIAIATMQEGALLEKPRRDIKGAGLRSSIYPKLIREDFEEYCVNLTDRIQKEGIIKIASILDHIANLEQKIYTSIKNKESIYLQTVSIKLAEDYEDPSVSSYFYYELWQDVFAHEFGDMIIPTKCFKIPLKGGKTFFKNPVFMQNLQDRYPDIHDRLLKFLEKYPNKNIQTILIPSFTGDIKDLFVDIMNIRSHISQSMMGYYHLLGGLGIGNINPDSDVLVSDFYNSTTPLLD